MLPLEQGRTITKTGLIKSIMDLLKRLGPAMHNDAPEPWLALNLTITQLKSLFFINFEGHSNSKMLAQALNVTPPNVTGIIDRLVEQGLVSREENPENRRMQLLKVTEKGVTLLSELNEQSVNRFSGILAQLSTDDLSALNRGLSALIETAERSKEN